MKKILLTLLVVFGLSGIASAQITKTVTTTKDVGMAPTRTKTVVVTQPGPRTVVTTKKVKHHRRHPRRRRVVKNTVMVPVVETRMETTR